MAAVGQKWGKSRVAIGHLLRWQSGGKRVARTAGRLKRLNRSGAIQSAACIKRSAKVHGRACVPLLAAEVPAQQLPSPARRILLLPSVNRPKANALQSAAHLKKGRENGAIQMAEMVANGNTTDRAASVPRAARTPVWRMDGPMLLPRAPEALRRAHTRPGPHVPVTFCHTQPGAHVRS